MYEYVTTYLAKYCGLSPQWPTVPNCKVLSCYAPYLFSYMPSLSS